MRKPNPNFPILCVALLATFALLFGSLAGFVPTTRPGIQCPTASVQLVKVAVKDCCDRVVGYEVRAPKIGERSFMQCRCAEKKSVQHEAIVTSKVVFFLNPLPEVTTTIDRPEVSLSPVSGDSTYLSVGFPPSVRPPSAA